MPRPLQNERGISALGVAVGFNRLEVVKLLIAKGGDLSFRDPKKNTLMHYAAGGCRYAVWDRQPAGERTSTLRHP